MSVIQFFFFFKNIDTHMKNKKFKLNNKNKKIEENWV